jgi:hypothetical protein
VVLDFLGVGAHLALGDAGGMVAGRRGAVLGGCKVDWIGLVWFACAGVTRVVVRLR